MPNGFHGSEAEWQRLEKPLERLDEMLGEFAKRRGLTLVKNERNSPNRTFRWGQRPSKLIQIFLESEASASYTVWACAYDDRSRAEYWQQKTLLKAASIEELARQLPELLSQAVLAVEGWEKAYR